MDEKSKARRKLIATLIVVLPILVGIAIVAIGHFFGHETEIGKPRSHGEIHRRVAATPAATGSPAPRVRLVEGATGRDFDSASLGSDPYTVLFVSTKCEAIGDFLGRAAAQLEEEGADAAILAITADPQIDSRTAVRAWLTRHHLPTRSVLHYLIGEEDEVRGYWNAWGFNGPSSECPDSVPTHLVSGSGVNTGIIDLEPDASAILLTGALTGISR